MRSYYLELVHKYPFMSQVIRFVIAGFINTASYFIVLNTLRWITGITQGIEIIIIASISFIIVNVQSYFINKYWTFQDKSVKNRSVQIVSFFIVSVLGFFINTGTVYFVTTIIGPQFNSSQAIWLNFAAICATAISMVWNFIGYKLIVFKKK